MMDLRRYTQQGGDMWRMMLAGCTGGDPVAAEETVLGEVEGLVWTTSDYPDGFMEVPLIDGVAFSNPAMEGSLHVALTSWADPGCDPAQWNETYHDIGFRCDDCDNDPSAFLVLAPDVYSEDAGPNDLFWLMSLGLWSSGWQVTDFGGGISWGQVELPEEGGTLITSAPAGDRVEGSAAGLGEGVEGGAVSFSLPYCGEVEWLWWASLD
jgi:hypothetical protein